MSGPKYSLLTLRMVKYEFSLPEMASRAQTTEAIVYHALIKRPIPRTDAKRILDAFSEMTGETYTLENVDLPIYDD
ncbi:hypothetical protein [Dictyobacter kobayashii]|nr:hypothetical protein [Dictyobacter kobayashii]